MKFRWHSRDGSNGGPGPLKLVRAGYISILLILYRYRIDRIPIHIARPWRGGRTKGREGGKKEGKEEWKEGKKEWKEGKKEWKEGGTEGRRKAGRKEGMKEGKEDVCMQWCVLL